MSDKKTYLLLPMIFCILFAVAARFTGIVYSVLATNIVYADSVICRLLPAIRQILSAASFACAAGGAVTRLQAHSSAKLPLLVYSVVLLVDGVAVILYDWISGVLEGRITLAILYRLGLVVYSVIMLLAGLVLASAMIKRKRSVKKAAVISTLLPIAFDLAAVLWQCITSLIEWEFLPFASEVYTMVFEIITVIIAGLISAVAAVIIVSHFTKNKTPEKTK